MIFLGAGASACFGIPTSPSLTRRIMGIINEKSPSLLSDIKKFLQTYSKDFDYENILTILTALTNPRQVNRDHYSLSFRETYPNHKGDYTKIINKMHEIICNCCTAPFDQETKKYLKPRKLESIFQNTYDLLMGVPLYGERDELVFSTNYDPSIELWCQKRFLNCVDGTKQTDNPELKQVLRNELALKAIRAKAHANATYLIRLHGSVWTYEFPGTHTLKFNLPRGRLLFSDLYENTFRQKPIIIFPGQEERLRRDQWDPFYQFFKEQLKGHCLFIGYSFRHDVINAPILDNLKNGRISKLGVLAPKPQKNLNNLFRGEQIPEDQIIEMPAKFGKADAAWQINSKWWKSKGTYSSSPAELKNAAARWRETREKEYIR